MQCFATCVMLNEFGICESAMRRPERIDKCPHRKMGGANIMSEQHPYIRTDVEPFESLWDAREWIQNKCLNSSKQLSDFRIFMEYSVTD